MDAEWRPAEVEAEIRAIAREAEDAMHDGTWWPVHPLDADAETPAVIHGVYFGAAGVVWALHRLAQAGLHEPRRDHAQLARDVLDSYLRRPEFGGPVPSLWMGEGGIALVAWLLAPARELAERLAELVVADPEDDTLELMWGSPGLLLIADAMLERTGEERWASAWRAIADSLLRRRGARVPGLWTQRLYGSVTEILGPAHGLAGIVTALARRPELLPPGRGSPPAPPRRCRPPRSATASTRTGRPPMAARSPTPAAPSAPSGATARPASSPRSPAFRRMTSSTRCSSRAAS